MINFTFGGRKKSAQSNSKDQQEQKVMTTPEQIDQIVKDFVSTLSEIGSVQKTIEVQTAASDALFVRRFKKFKSVQEYLDFLKVMKFANTYKEFHVDLDNGSIESIDAFCKSALGDEYEKDYYPVQIITIQVTDDAKASAAADNNVDESDITPQDIMADEKTEKDLKSKMNKEVKVEFDNIIKEEGNNESEIKFYTDDQVKGTASDKTTDSSGEGTEGNVSEANSNNAGNRSRNDSSGNNEAGTTSTTGGTSTLTAEQQELKRELDGVANLVKKYVEKGTTITVQKSKYHDGSNIGTYDVTIEDQNGTRSYCLDRGSILPGKTSLILTTEDNFTVAIPLIKKQKDLLKKSFSALTKISREEFEELYNAYYMPDMSLYNNIDFTDALFINNMNKNDRIEFAKNLKYVVETVKNNNGRDLRYRISRFKWIDDFDLSSDSKCISPIPGIMTSNEIGFVKITYKRNHNITMDFSDDRKEWEKQNATSAPKMEVKDHRNVA